MPPIEGHPADVRIGRLAAFPWLPARLREKDRFGHMQVVGPTGCGKTSMVLVPMLAQDLASGAGVVAIEPKDGDLLEAARRWCEASGRPYTLWNPTHPSCPVFNPLAGDSTRAAERMVYALSRMTEAASTSAGAEFYAGIAQSVLRHSIFALKACLAQGATLEHLQLFLRSEEYRREILAKCDDSHVLDYFSQEFGAWSDRDRVTYLAGLLNRLSLLLGRPEVRHSLCGRNAVDLDRILAEGGVLLIALQIGELGQMAHALGTLWMYTLQFATFARQDKSHSVFVYIDEFQNYVTPGFAEFLTMARSYRVGAILAHQNLAQLRAAGGEPLQETVVTNTKNKVIFGGLTAPDAELLTANFGTEPREDRQITYGPDGSRTLSYSVREQPRLHPTRLMDLPFGMAALRLVHSNSLNRPALVHLRFARQPPITPTRREEIAP